MTLIFYAPSISGNIYFIWLMIFSGDRYGIANGMLIKLGIILEPIQWLKTEALIMPIIILVQLWLSLGTGFLAFIAGLQTVDKTLYEAGAVDGVRNRWQELWYITSLQCGHSSCSARSFSLRHRLPWPTYRLRLPVSRA